MSTLSPREMFALDNACAPMLEMIPSRKGHRGGIYLVGTAMQPRGDRPPRDIDVRMILADKVHDRLGRAIGGDGIAFLGLALGEYLAARTGLPIDFQIQRMTEANALHQGPRNPLGHRTMASYHGDAQAVDMVRMLKTLQAENPTPAHRDPSQASNGSQPEPKAPNV